MNRNLHTMSALFFSALLVSSTSCDTEKDPAPVQENQVISDPNAILSTAEVSEINFAGINYKFQYGDNNLVESVEESFTFEEEEDGVVVIIDLFSNYDLVYTDKRLSSMDVDTEVTYSTIENGVKEVLLDETGAYSITAQYNSKKLLSSLTEAHEGNTTIKISREYDGENRLIKESHTENSEEVQYQTYQWADQNVTSDKLFYQEGDENGRKIRVDVASRRKQALFLATRKASQPGLLSEENTYADFDEKANPLNVLSLFGFSNGIVISENNPRQFTVAESEGQYTAEISHTYDSKGRVKKYTLTDPEEGPVHIELTYRN